MNNNACTNLIERASKQGQLRRKLLMSQAEAQNKTNEFQDQSAEAQVHQMQEENSRADS